MTATIPKVQVFNRKNPVRQNPGLAGRIAVIGAFKTEESNPILCNSLYQAYEELGDDDTFNGCAILEDLFYGASSLLAVNVATKSGSTWTKTITTDNLTEALAKIRYENFDMIFIADTVTDAFFPILTTFTKSRFKNKKPVGYVAAITGANVSAYTTTVGLVDDFCYGLVTQGISVDYTEKSLLKSAAYYCGVLAALNVGSTMTTKQVPDVTGLTTEYTFEDGDLGKALVGLGITVFNCYDRENNIYEVVNSEQPNGYDLYINRVRDYVVREFALREFLGNRNRQATWSEINQEISRVKGSCVDTLDLLADIEYNVVKKSSKCVDINITRLLFDDIITEIDVYITIEVQ